MGFGILLTGYLFNLNFVAKQGIFWGVSSIIMLYALTRLYEYNLNFKRTFYVCVPMTLMALGAAALEVYGLFVGDAVMESSVAGTMLTWLLTLHPIVMGVFTYLLTMAVMDIGRETEASVVYQRAYIQRFLCVIFYSLMTFFSFSFDISSLPNALVVTYNAARIVVCVFGLVFIMLTARMLFSCYAWICLPEDYYMETRKEKRERALDALDRSEDEDEPSSGGKGVKLTQNTGGRAEAVHPSSKKNRRRR